jgi:hypothetical protein
LYGALVTAHCTSSGAFSEYSDEFDATTQAMAGQILTMIHGLAATAAKHGFYLHRWIRVVNVMIYKKTGCIELEKLRVIHLFEADFNLMIGILFGHRAMHHQVDNHPTSPSDTNGKPLLSLTSSTGHSIMPPPYQTPFSNVCLLLSGFITSFPYSINNSSSTKVHRRTVRLHAVAKTKPDNTSPVANIPSDNSLGLPSFRLSAPSWRDGPWTHLYGDYSYTCLCR